MKTFDTEPLYFDVILLSDVISSIGQKISDCDTIMFIHINRLLFHL